MSAAANSVYAIGITEVGQKLHLMEIPRRDVGPNDVKIDIKYCGVCHSDVHHVRQEWGPTGMPAVPGHEMTGYVSAVGSNVTKFKVGDAAGVGCFVGSCRECAECGRELVQYCAKGPVNTYGSKTNDAPGVTCGGYAQTIVVDADYVLRIPANLDLAASAPLLCAGITVWSPMKHYGVKAGDHVAVLGLGGLGHMAVKLAVALGATVTVLSRSQHKAPEALQLGASNVLITSDPAAFAGANRTFDFLIDTVSAKHDINAYCTLLKTDGTIMLMGAGPTPLELVSFFLIQRRIKIGGSNVGGITETQQMLDFCGEHNIVSDIELVSVNQVEKAWERMLKGDVKFRFVLDVGETLRADSVVEV
ncbi:hypothetical protein HDU83_008760 [Entophlyctis luteolus]|nr:hypothetical protein HDU82_002280 [Entophlyctis luteolus]KAJ3337454.1 hypothetical protein HDU83_008760 [Entophlyctis luteolus]KAJ3388320.1 hypothetical protein HDU84_009834 [Entophlyctis sp. JEL0112]